MIDASLAVSSALVARLRAEVPALGSRVYDRPPKAVDFPYARIGDTQALDDGGQDLDICEITVTLHVYSRAVGAAETRGLCRTIAASLKGWLPDLTAAGFVAVSLHQPEAKIFEEQDGHTTHGVITVTASVEPSPAN